MNPHGSAIQKHIALCLLIDFPDFSDFAQGGRWFSCHTSSIGKWFSCSTRSTGRWFSYSTSSIPTETAEACPSQRLRFRRFVSLRERAPKSLSEVFRCPSSFRCCSPVCSCCCYRYCCCCYCASALPCGEGRRRGCFECGPHRSFAS